MVATAPEPDGGKAPLGPRSGKGIRKVARREQDNASSAWGPGREGRQASKPAEAEAASGAGRFEGALLRLMWSQLKLVAIYQNVDTIDGSGKNARNFRGVLRDSIIVNLHNFLRARKDMLDDPRYRDLDGRLDPLIRPILDVKTPIKRLRDEYIAHVQERRKPFGARIQDIVDRHLLDMHEEYWLALARSAATYAMYVQANYADRIAAVVRRYDETSPLPLMHGHGDSTQYYGAHVKATSEAACRLRSGGYETTPQNLRVPARLWNIFYPPVCGGA